MSKLKSLVIIFGIIGFPLALVLILKQGTTQLNNLPVYGPKSILASGDSLYFTVKDSFLENTNQMQDNHLILHFFVDSLSGKNDIQLTNLYKVGKVIDEVDDIKIVSFSSKKSVVLDSLKKDYWITISNSNRLNLIREQLLEARTEKLSFEKEGFVVLLDKQRRIRGYYKMRHPKFKERILSELIVLRNEYTN